MADTTLSDVMIIHYKDVKESTSNLLYYTLQGCKSQPLIRAIQCQGYLVLF